jgi:hypothetical protein
MSDTSMPKENDRKESQVINEKSDIISYGKHVVSSIFKDCAKELTLYVFSLMIAIIFFHRELSKLSMDNFVEILSLLIATSLFTIIGVTIGKKLRSNFISVNKRTSIIKAILLLLVATMIALVANLQEVSNLDTTLLIGFILLNAFMALFAPIIPSDRTLLRPIMAAVPGANLVAVAILGGAVISGGFASFGGIPPLNLSGLADLTIVNDCEIPIHYGGFGDKIPHVDIEPFGIQTIQIPGKLYDVHRDGSKIIIKGIYPLPIKVEKDTRIIFDGKEIKPGSEMILDIIPNSSHRLIIGCMV